MNLNGSRNSSLLSWVSLIGSGILGFEEENLPFDSPKSVFGGEDLFSTVTGVGLASFWVGLGSLGKWVGSRVAMDTPTQDKPKIVFHPKPSTFKVFLVGTSLWLKPFN